VSVVVDASSLLAFLNDEPGADAVWSALAGGLVSTVNWSEVVQKSLQREADVVGMRQDFSEAGLSFMPFTAEQSEIAAELWQSTRRFGLSLADRACLALARERQLSVLTADRAWTEMDLGFDVRLIR